MQGRRGRLVSQLDVVSDKSDIPLPIGRHPESREPEKTRQPDKTRHPEKSPDKSHVEKVSATKAHAGKTHTDEDHPVTHVVAHPDARADSGIFLGQRFPDLTIATPRLHVRPLTVADTKPVDDVFGDRLTQRWLPFPAEFGPIDGRAWCTNMAAERRAMGSGDHYGIVRRDDDSLIGCMWTKRTDWSARSTEVSFAIAPEARGFGFAAEAIDGLAIGRASCRERVLRLV